jgi:hypothetical protein
MIYEGRGDLQKIPFCDVPLHPENPKPTDTKLLTRLPQKI